MAQLNPSGEGAQQATFLPPSELFAHPAGFVAPAIFQSTHPPETKAKMAEVAVMLAKDPVAMRLFCDRIYQLLQDDLQANQDRSHSYGRRH